MTPEIIKKIQFVINYFVGTGINLHLIASSAYSIGTPPPILGLVLFGVFLESLQVLLA